MKLTKLAVIGSAMALVASPVAFANKGGAAKPDVVEIQDAETEPEVTVCEEAPDNDGAVAEEAGPSDEGEVTTTDEKSDEVAVDEPVAEGGEGTVDPAVCEGADGEPVPLDWVKRGGGDNPDVIFYNMAGGEAPVFKNETNAAAKDLGQDEKATSIEAQDNSAAAQIKREKKAPVALVKKGRVFLR